MEKPCVIPEPAPQSLQRPQSPLFRKYVQIPRALLADLETKRLRPIDIVTYALLAGHTFRTPESHPSQERLATLAACSKKTIQRSKNRLVKAGYIERVGKKGSMKVRLIVWVEGGRVTRDVAKTKIQRKPAL